jgi:O-antigen ligase
MRTQSIYKSSGVRAALGAPPGSVECIYAALLFYNNLGPVVGLPAGQGSGPMLLLLGIYCALSLDHLRKAVFRSLRLPILCAVFEILVQVLVHGTSPLDSHIRYFVNWIVALVVIHSLFLRPNFLHRFALTLLCLSLTALPFLSFRTEGFVVERAVATGDISGDFRNANGLGVWFGFCCTYLAVVGLETRRNLVRIASWLGAASCLYVVGLSVSRGALFATALALVVAFRRLLRKGFVPLLGVVLLVGVFLVLGVFDTVTARYLERGDEETGRMVIWPAALERYFESPITGVGILNIGTYIPEFGKVFTPHNTFISLALGSGVLPLLFFLGYLMRTFRQATSPGAPADYGPFRLPFLIYTAITAMAGDYVFMAPWALLALSIPSASMTGLRVPAARARRVPLLNSPPLASRQDVRPLIKRYQR